VLVLFSRVVSELNKKVAALSGWAFTTIEELKNWTVDLKFQLGNEANLQNAKGLAGQIDAVYKVYLAKPLLLNTIVCMS
jgi:hypothetical protein